MRYVTVASDFVGGVHYHHTLIEVIGEDTRYLAQHGGLAHPRPPQKQDASARLDQVLNQGDGAKDGAADAAGKPHDAPLAVADSRDAMQSARDTGTVVIAKSPDARDRVLNVINRYLFVAEKYVPAPETRLGRPTQVDYHLQKLAAVFPVAYRFRDMARERIEKRIQVISDYFLHKLQLPPLINPLLSS
jgi:hypothetical protein